jgi:flagellin
MPSVINTNLPSLNTQRNLNTSQAALATTIQRLSSGLRVNSAKDDAAGLAIAERMNAQVRGLNVAQRNANDGVSLAQTAEGALGKAGEMIQRMRELAVQSSNATNRANDRTALNEEVKQLQAEIQRLATTTNFNGTKLLDGSFADQNFQVGADAGQSIMISNIADARLTGLGKLQSTTGIAPATMTAVTAGDIKINGVDLAALPDTTAAADPALARGTDFAAAVNAVTGQTGVSATVDASGIVTLSSAGAITVGLSGTGTVGTTGFLAGATDPAYTAAAAGQLATTMAGDLSSAYFDVTTAANSQVAIMRADAALNTINSARAQLGAVQSRFESAVSNIQITAENTTAARSRIVDADFAAETAAMTRAQILQQAGTAMLSQANQIPQQVLSLLK